MAKTDYLIIGSGAAGLSLAIKLAMHFEDKQVTVITKSEPIESNTKYAQGGLAVVSNRLIDSFEKHISDTLIAGDGLCERDVVEMVVSQAPDCVEELMSWGVEFDTDIKGKLDLGMEGGHSEKRVVHHKDSTGKEIEKTLVSKANSLANLDFMSGYFAVDFLVENSGENRSCEGVLVFNEQTKEYEFVQSQITCIATGGAGQVYQQSTNPFIATGDGLAMALRAEVAVNNMEFVQFHPTAMRQGEGPAFLISEAVRGYGAYLRNSNGERFVLQYDPRGELASRDIVSRAIYNEQISGEGGQIYLDCTHLNQEFKTTFPNIHSVCAQNGLDLAIDWIPISPAAHYLCGGIVVDKKGHTNLDKLYACGECTYTGLHGANRLASNAILEALVYANNIYRELMENPLIVNTSRSLEQKLPSEAGQSQAWSRQMRKSLQGLMTENVGIIRTNKGLKIAKLEIQKAKEIFQQEVTPKPDRRDLLELRNLLDVADIIVTHSAERKENKGGFYNSDLNRGEDINRFSEKSNHTL